MNAPARLARLHAQALGYPEAYEELPWGHPAIKVRKKVFVFCSALGTEDPSLSVKLPHSRDRALAHPSVSPMGYGLGKHGWCSFDDLTAVRLEELLDYLDESYRAVAPKTLLRKLGDARPAPRAIATPEAAPADELPRVLVIGAGPRRRQRAVRALVEAGCPAADVGLDEALDAAGGLQPEVLVVDVGRESGEALACLAGLGPVCPDALVVVAGTKPGRSLTGGEASVTTAPPGDPESVTAILAALSSGGRLR